MAYNEGLKPLIESLIFASIEPITIEKLVSVIEGENKASVKEAVTDLLEDYRSKNGGFIIEELAGGYAFRTNHTFSPWIRRLYKIGFQKLSKAAMETLAIVAYRQPLTRAELEAVRGVDSGGVLSTLMEKRFIKIVGRKEVPGRPVVYGTTKEFLETFDLKDLSCLPSLKEIQNTEEEDVLIDARRRQGAQEDGQAGQNNGSGQNPDEEASKTSAEATASEDSQSAGAAEASEADSGLGGDIEEEGRGADSSGAGDGEPDGGQGAGSQG